MDKKSTYGLTVDQLADLLSVGIDSADFLNEIKGDDDISKILHRRLISSLPKNATLLDSLLVIMGKMGYGMQSFAGKSLGDVLLDTNSDIGLLQAIKTYGKKLSLTADSERESAVAVTIYHAAIASALVHHDERISSSSYSTLEKSFSLLLSKKWITPELKKMLSKACTICQTKQKEK